MASEKGESCELYLHMRPLRGSRVAEDLAESGVKLPNWIQHWALVFIWKDSDRALKAEAMESEDGKSVVVVTEMNVHDGERQTGTKVDCGRYQLTYDRVKTAAEKLGADPPAYNLVTENCQLFVKKLLEELGISVDVLTVLGEILKLATVLEGPEAAEKLKAGIMKVAAQ